MARAQSALTAIDPQWQVQRRIIRRRCLTLAGPTAADGVVGRAGMAWAAALIDSPTHATPWSTEPASNCPSAPLEVVTLHDVVAWRFADESAPVRSVAAELRRAAAVICVSEFSAGEAHDPLGVRNPVAVPNGVDPAFPDAVAAPTEVLAGLGLTGPFVLHAGAPPPSARTRRPRAGLATRPPGAPPTSRLPSPAPRTRAATPFFSGMPGAARPASRPARSRPGGGGERDRRAVYVRGIRVAGVGGHGGRGSGRRRPVRGPARGRRGRRPARGPGAGRPRAGPARRARGGPDVADLVRRGRRARGPPGTQKAMGMLAVWAALG